MSYGTYMNIRDTAWEYLLRNNISSLPVDVMSILRNEGIHVKQNSVTNALSPGMHGISYCDGNHWYTVYDDTDPMVVSRFTVAHELGHSVLRHELMKLRYGSNLKVVIPKPISEKQADQFAIRILCPAIILHALELETPEEIAAVCKVDMKIAEKRADRMIELNKRNKFLTSEHERRVYENFKLFIHGVQSGKIKLERTINPLEHMKTEKPEATAPSEYFSHKDV